MQSEPDFVGQVSIFSFQDKLSLVNSGSASSGPVSGAPAEKTRRLPFQSVTSVTVRDTADLVNAFLSVHLAAARDKRQIV